MKATLMNIYTGQDIRVFSAIIDGEEMWLDSAGTSYGSCDYGPKPDFVIAGRIEE